jgi:agmatine deiminase
MHRKGILRRSSLAAAVLAAVWLPWGASATEPSSSKRVPAEWEPQEAIWLQWPGRYEKTYEPAFAKMANVIVAYEKLHILFDNDAVRDQARDAISAAGGDPDHDNITWHTIANDSAWMRDNGPVYVIEDGEIRIQDWRFDAWGGAFGAAIPYAKDDAVPSEVGAYLNMPVDRVDIVHERGNLEFNGDGAVILNWSTIGDPRRNPDYTKAQAEADLKRHFGVDKVVFIEGVPEGDLTNGHVDGIARFINPSTVVVPQCTAMSLCRPGDGRNDAIFEAAAAAIAQAGFRVVRFPIEGTATAGGYTFDTNYMNWIVGNGFVIVVGFDNPETDGAAKSRIETFFPGRDVYVIDMLESWVAGGGAHCHTNDQPALSTADATQDGNSGG